MVERAGLTPTIAVVPPTDSNLHLPFEKWCAVMESNHPSQKGN